MESTFHLGKDKKKSKDNSPDGSAAQKCTENNGEKHFHNYDSAYGKVSFRVTEKFPGLDAYNRHETTCPVLCGWLSLEMTLLNHNHRLQ